jgi:hypothetical protein
MLDDIKSLEKKTEKNPEAFLEILISAALFTYSFCLLALC